MLGAHPTHRRTRDHPRELPDSRPHPHHCPLAVQHPARAKRPQEAAKPTEGEGTLTRANTIVFSLIVLLATTVALVVVTRADGEQPKPVIRTSSIGPHTIRAERCPTAQRAISFYRGKYRAHREAMDASGPVPRAWYPCDAAKRRAAEWRDRAAKAKDRLTEWTNDQWAWERWLPAKWQRIGACETGYGQVPGNWRHNSGTYQGSFGFHHQSWDGFVSSADPRWGPYPSEAYLATPRQQYEVALAIYRRYGLSGWGCRGA